MYDSMNVIKKDPQVRININNMLQRYDKLSYNYQSKTGNFIQV